MVFDTAANLVLLESSDELRALQAALLRTQTNTFTELQALEDGTELGGLQKTLVVPPAPNVFEVLEEFERLDRNDEHLHSRFLEFFLNPSEKRHAVLDTFLKALLKKAVYSRNDRPARDLDFTGDVSDTDIKREATSEQGRADFKLRNSRQGFVLVIENKTQSSEGERQLEKYWEDAKRSDPDFAIGGIFITPEGRQPKTAGKYKYIAVSYGDIAAMLDKCVEHGDADDAGVIFTKQYASAIRRWFVEDPEKKKLAWRIYRKYPDAAAYLSSDGAKPLWQISDHLQDSIKQQSPDLEIIHPNWSTKTLELWFVSREWDKVDGLRHAGTKEKEKQADDRLIVFWFYCDPGSEHEYDRQLNLCLGTAPGARPDDVKKLIGAMKGGPSSSQSIVVDEEPRSGSEWTTLWGRTFLTEDQLNQEDRDIVFGLIDDGWGRFLRDDLPKIRSVIAAHFTEPKRLGATP